MRESSSITARNVGTLTFHLFYSSPCFITNMLSVSSADFLPFLSQHIHVSLAFCHKDQTDGFRTIEKKLRAHGFRLLILPVKRHCIQLIPAHRPVLAQITKCSNVYIQYACVFQCQPAALSRASRKADRWR